MREDQFDAVVWMYKSCGLHLSSSGKHLAECKNYFTTENKSWEYFSELETILDSYWNQGFIQIWATSKPNVSKWPEKYRDCTFSVIDNILRVHVIPIPYIPNTVYGATCKSCGTLCPDAAVICDFKCYACRSGL